VCVYVLLSLGLALAFRRSELWAGWGTTLEMIPTCLLGAIRTFPFV